MNWCSLVSIRGCTDAGRNLRPTILWFAYESNKGECLAHLLEKAFARKLITVKRGDLTREIRDEQHAINLQTFS
jgi:hypothetical protein